MLLTWGTVYAILSKNNLKANHNPYFCVNISVLSICNLIKEQSESKSQPIQVIDSPASEYMQSYQRTI